MLLTVLVLQELRFTYIFLWPARLYVLDLPPDFLVRLCPCLTRTSRLNGTPPSPSADRRDLVKNLCMFAGMRPVVNNEKDGGLTPVCTMNFRDGDRRFPPRNRPKLPGMTLRRSLNHTFNFRVLTR